MIQRHILLRTLTGQTSAITSGLQIVNGYEVNNVQGLGDGIVNASNVRAFLNSDVNESIISDFFSYLTGSTTHVEFIEIYSSDQNLSNIFNNYYVSSVLNNQTPSTSAIDQSLTGTSGVTIIENTIFNFDGVAPEKGLLAIPLSIDDSTRQLKVFSALTTYTTEPSYYIPVYVNRNYSQMDREKLDFENISTLIASFVPDIEETQDESENPEVFTFEEYSYGSYSYGSSSTPPFTIGSQPLTPSPSPDTGTTTDSVPFTTGKTPSTPSTGTTGTTIVVDVAKTR